MRGDVAMVGFFTAAYLLVASSFALATQNWEFIYYIAVVLLLALTLLIVHRRVHLPIGVLWGLSVWGLLHMVGGLVPVPEAWPIAGGGNVFLQPLAHPRMAQV